MNRKIAIIFEYFYLLIAIFFTYEAINNWNSEDNSKSYMFLFFVVIAIFMFFFRRNFRKKVEKRSQE